MHKILHTNQQTFQREFDSLMIMMMTKLTIIIIIIIRTVAVAEMPIILYF